MSAGLAIKQKGHTAPSKAYEAAPNTPIPTPHRRREFASVLASSRVSSTVEPALRRAVTGKTWGRSSVAARLAPVPAAYIARYGLLTITQWPLTCTSPSKVMPCLSSGFTNLKR